MPGEVETTRRLPSWCPREQLKTIIRAFYYVCQADAERNSDPDASFEASRHDDTRWWMQWAWRFCFWQGLRREEVVQIRCGGIDLENRQMVVGDEEFIPKGKREDVIPLSEPAAEIAEEWGAAHFPPSQRLFRHSQADKSAGLLPKLSCTPPAKWPVATAKSNSTFQRRRGWTLPPQA